MSNKLKDNGNTWELLDHDKKIQKIHINQYKSMKYILKNKLKQEKCRFHIFKIIHKRKKNILCRRVRMDKFESSSLKNTKTYIIQLKNFVKRFNKENL